MCTCSSEMFNTQLHPKYARQIWSALVVLISLWACLLIIINFIAQFCLLWSHPVATYLPVIPFIEFALWRIILVLVLDFLLFYYFYFPPIWDGLYASESVLHRSPRANTWRFLLPNFAVPHHHIRNTVCNLGLYGRKIFKLGILK